jgi:uncharacterized cupin superfamily protein
MAKIFRADRRKFCELSGKIDPYKVFTDAQMQRQSGTLNFDIRRLDPVRYSAPYHFHRYAEELFMILQGSATLRTPEGFQTVGAGDVIWFEAGEAGAHQLRNHTDEACVYLDVRTFIGYDVCGYPDSDKILLAPSMEVFRNEDKAPYFEGEEQIDEVWRRLGQMGK